MFNTLNRLWIFLIGVITFSLTPAVSTVQAGVGARHFLEGALFAKYLTKPPKETKTSRVLTYSSAFFVGVLSHGISDHIGNYEPHSDQPEYYYFIGEGLLGCALLIPEWRKDPRLFWGSVGGVAPDIDQIEPFGRKLYPTHSGEIPHYKVKKFWHGVVMNLAMNSAAYLAIHYDLLSDEDFRSRFSVGYSFGYWDSKGALRHGIDTWPSGKNGSPFRRIHLLYKLQDFLTVNLSFGDWIRDICCAEPTDKDYPPRVNLDSYTLSMELYPYKLKWLQPYVAIGPAIYHTSISRTVNKGEISFSTHITTTLGMQAGAGLKINLSRSMRLVFDERYHEVHFSKSVDGMQDYSGWSTGLGIEHQL
jgi:opacity protein-like surface antigen